MLKSATAVSIEPGYCLVCIYEWEQGKAINHRIGLIRPDEPGTCSWIDVPWPNGQPSIPAPFLRRQGDFLAFAKILAASHGLRIEPYAAGEYRTALIFRA